MDEREKRLLVALVKMVRQYLEHRPGGLVDSYSMSAGEHAISVLAEYGLMQTETARFGLWTEAGSALWNSL